jgi:hypothetical protein
VALGWACPFAASFVWRCLSGSAVARRLCRPCPDALAKRVGQSRAGHLAIRQLATTDNDDSARLALATPSAALGTHPLVPGPNGTIVALARKLLAALWKYVSAGVVIEGAMIRPA